MTRLAQRQSPLGTIAQSVPRMRAILGNMRPTWHLRSIAELGRDFLDRHGIRGVVWDVDGTLTRFHAAALAEEATALGRLLDDPGVRHAILSNADERRFRELGVIFPAIRVMKGYRVDGVLRMRVLHRGTDTPTPRRSSPRARCRCASPMAT